MMEISPLCKAGSIGIFMINRLSDIKLECILMAELWFNLRYLNSREIKELFLDSSVVNRFFSLAGKCQEKDNYEV